MAQTMYEIRVAGAVPEEDLQDMGAVPVEPAQVNTVLYGVSDQAALYGLLDRLRALGIVVLEVRRVPSVAVDQDEGVDPLDEEPDGEREA
jgi:hypothetical protein